MPTGISHSPFVNQVFTSTTIYLYAGERVRVALAYLSNPSADYSSNPLEGDLDLLLVGPASTVVASSAGVHSWEIIDYTTTVAGLYTVRIYNFGNTLAPSESTYAGVAVWPGHYVLQPYAAQVRDEPPGGYSQDSGDDYRFVLQQTAWNAVGLWSPSGGDYDLFLFNNSLYGDPADRAWLEDSILVTSPDIVVVDGNHAPHGNYYLNVAAFSGTGDYRIQHANSTAFLVGDGSFGPYTANGQSLRIWDIHFSTNQRRCILVVPTGGNADLGILLFDSEPGNPSSMYQGRSQAVADVDNSGPGGVEALNYQSPDTDRKGLVVYNKEGTSNYFVRVSSGNCASFVPAARK